MENEDEYEELELTPEFYQDKNLKSFIRVGMTFIDIKQTIGFSFLKDPEGYIIIQFVYDTGRAMNAFVKDRNEFALFLLQLDRFIDDQNTLVSMQNLIDDVEKELGIKPKKSRNKKTQNN